MTLPGEDVEFLCRDGYEFEVFEEGGMLCVLLSSVTLPPGLNVAAADVLLRLSLLYPDAPPDMWWMSPAVFTATGAEVAATQLRETYRNREWQRWSRHLNGNSWLAGVDGLESYLALLWSEMLTAAGVAA